MQSADARLEFANARSGCLDHELTLACPFDRTFPAIDGLHRGKEIHARSQPFLDQLRRELLRITLRGKRRQDDDELVRGH